MHEENEAFLEPSQNQINELQSHLINAIKNSNSEQVLSCIHQGADLNNYDKDGNLPLATALLLDDNNPLSINIIQLLLEQGANYLSIIEVDCCVWESAFDYCFHNDISYKFIMVLIEHARRQNTFAKISIDSLEFEDNDDIVPFLIENGINKGSGGALKIALNVRHPLYEDSVTRGSLYKNLKLLYNHAVKNNELSLDEEQLHILLRIAIEENDFETAWYLIKNQNANINLATNNCINSNFRPILIVLLKAAKTHYGRYFSAILTLKLNGNFLFTQQKLKNILVENSIKKKKNLASINRETLRLAKLIDTKLYSAMTTFLHPFQKPIHPDFPLKVRLKLAVAYLRNELNDNIVELSNHQLKKLLLDRSAYYFFEDYPKIITEWVTDLGDVPENYKIQFLEVMKNSVNKFPENSVGFYALPQKRTWMLNKLKTIEFVEFSNASQFENYLKNFIRLSSNNLTKDASVFQGFLIQYGLGFTVERQFEKILFNLLYTPKIKTLTNNYQDLKIIISYLQSENDPFNNYFSLEKKIPWLAERLMMFAIKIGLLKNVNELLSYCMPSRDTLILATKLDRNEIVKVLVDKAETNLDIYQLLVRSALEKKNFPLVSFFFKQMENISIKMFYYPSNSFDIVSKLFLHIVSSKQMRFMQNLNRIAKNCGIHQQFLKLFDTYEKFLPKDITYKNNINLSDDKESLSVSNSIATEKALKPIHERNQTATAILSKLVHIKLSNIDMKNYLASYYSNKHKSPLFLTNLTNDNYKKLVERLTDPSHLPKKIYLAILKEKEADGLLNVANILTPREKKLYAALMGMKWKGAHGIRNPDDLQKIIASKSIKSPQLRRNLGEEVTNQTTPHIYRLGRIVFLTLGPQKAPTPFFLKNAPYIEFDIDKLLAKYPDFFKNAYLSSHWYSFNNQQSYQPIKFNNTIVYTDHQRSLQNNYCFQPNKNSINIMHNIFDNLFYGKRLIHILCLLFIDKLRTFEYEDAYVEILNNVDNLDLLSEKFSAIMHPGLFEIRIPHAIDLDESFFEIKQPTKVKILTEEEIVKALSDVDLLQSYIKEGFDCDQPSVVYVEYKGKTKSYFVNFFARAILSQSEPVIDFLFSHDQAQFEIRDPGYLSALRAAILVNDRNTAIKLMTQGIPFKKILKAYQMPRYDNELMKFFRALSVTELSQLAEHAHMKAITYDLLQAVFEHVPTNYQEKQMLMSAIKKIASAASYPGLTAELKAAILHSIEAGWNDYVLLLLEMTDYSFNIIQPCLVHKNIDLIVSILELENNYQIFNGLDYLWLFIAGETELFQQAVCKSLHEDYIGKNTDEMLDIVIHHLYENFEDDLTEFLQEKEYLNLSIVDDESLDKALRVIFDMSKFGNYIKDFRTIELIELLMNTLGNTITLKNVTIFINQYNFTHWEGLLESHSDFETEDYHPAEIKEYFDYLKYKHQHYIQALKGCRSKNIFEYVDANYVLKIFLNNYDIYTTIEFYDIFSDFCKLDSLIQKIFSKTIEPNLIAHWLIRTVNNERTFKSFLDPKVKNSLRTALRPILPELLSEHSLKEYANVYQARLYLFLHYLFPDHCPDYKFNTQNFWSVRYLGQIDSNENIKSEEFTFWQRYHDRNKQRNSTALVRQAVATFITCTINGELSIYLGKKIIFGARSNYLLAPGGFIQDNKEYETILGGALREIKEETGYLINIPSLVESSNQLNENGEIIFTSDGEINSFHTPAKITYLYQYKSFDNFNTNNHLQHRFIHFLWFNYSNDISNLFASADDFAEGRWVPLSKIERTDNGSYHYLKQPILQSNGMFIDYIQNKYVGLSLLDEVIYRENYTRAMGAQALRKIIQQGNSSSTLFFPSPANNPGKRPATEQIDNTDRKINKLGNKQ